jgi:hypothetical protein
VTWNVGAMLAGATATLTFTVTVVPPPLTCNWSSIRNYAQVTHVDQPVHSTPNSFANPVTGPVVEHDEASAGLLLRDCAPVIGTPYLLVTKSSLESCLPAGQQTPVPSTAPACTFTVKVQAVGNFVGNVVFGDAVFTSPGGAPVPSKLSSITLTPPPAPSTQTYPCVLAFTTTAAQCTQNNVTLNNGHTITFTFTLAAPPNLAPGNYKNCFMAAQSTLPAAQQAVPYYNANAPISQWYPWGDCGVFTVPTPASGIVVAPTCNPETAKREGGMCVCRFPSMTKSSQTNCTCPANMKFVPGAGCIPQAQCMPPLALNAAGTECIEAPVCSPPMVPGPVAGQCICPLGTVQMGRECVKQTTCQPPMVPGPVAGQCICPPPTHLVGNKCEGPPPPPSCQPPMVPGPVAGQCLCPQGTVQQGKRCVPPIECRSPLIPNAAGTDCVCRPGLVQKGRTCVEPVVCNPPAKLNRRGACQCPTDMVAKGNSCVERERQGPQISPGDIIRNIPGGGRDIPRGGRDNDNPRGGRDTDPPRGGGQGPVDLPGRR